VPVLRSSTHAATLLLALFAASLTHRAWAAETPVEALIEAIVPETEAYIADGMKTFDLPGLAIGIVANDRLVYGMGFGACSKAGGSPVDTDTIFQIGSATKGFLATTMALLVDRGRFKWDDRVIDRDADFQLKDPWVTREFRIFDLLAQRSGLPPYANDGLAMLGLDRAGLVRSLRHVEPVSSFRSAFAYTNVTHILAGRIVAKAADAPDWNAVLQKELLDPLGMKETTYTAASIEAAPNHASGYRWTPDGTVEVPFTQIFPYDFDGAGDINSNIDDASRWLRFQLGNGAFEGRQLASTENLAVTHTPKVAMSDKVSYAMGWVVQQTPNGVIVWHNGGTTSFGAYFGIVSDKSVGVVVLTNETNVGFPDAIGRWVLDRLLNNPSVDHVADAFKAARATFERSVRLFAKPDNPRPFPPLAPLIGTFTSPSIGKAIVAQDGDVLNLSLEATGAKLGLDPWDGGIFTARLMPLGKFAALAANLGPLPNAFVQFQMDKDARLNVLHLSFDDGQAYDFTREQQYRVRRVAPPSSWPAQAGHDESRGRS
jgi:CubicO group peptidase (beta-lactamase class C family)